MNMKNKLFQTGKHYASAFFHKTSPLKKMLEFKRYSSESKKLCSFTCDISLSSVTSLVTIQPMIKSFIHKGLEDFFYDGTRKGVQVKHASKLEAILDRLDAANEIKDTNYPGSGFHPLLPKTKGR